MSADYESVIVRADGTCRLVLPVIERGGYPRLGTFTEYVLNSFDAWNLLKEARNDKGSSD